jgi:hypothetical protein
MFCLLGALALKVAIEEIFLQASLDSELSKQSSMEKATE